MRMILIIAGILKGAEFLLRNTSGNVKIANLLKTIPESIFIFFLNSISKMSYIYFYYLTTI